MSAPGEPYARVLRELSKGGAVTPDELVYRTKLGAAAVADALCQLEEAGLITPYAWRRTRGSEMPDG